LTVPLDIFETLVIKRPSDPAFRCHLGVAMMKKGDMTNAKRELRTALASKPFLDDEGNIKELLAKIEGHR